MSPFGQHVYLWGEPRTHTHTHAHTHNTQHTSTNAYTQHAHTHTHTHTRMLTCWRVDQGLHHHGNTVQFIGDPNVAKGYPLLNAPRPIQPLILTMLNPQN